MSTPSHDTNADRLPRPHGIETGRIARLGLRYWRLDRPNPDDRGNWVPVSGAAESRRAALDYWGPMLTLALVGVSGLLWLTACLVAVTISPEAGMNLTITGGIVFVLATVIGLAGYLWSRLERKRAATKWQGFRPDTIDEIAQRLEMAP